MKQTAIKLSARGCLAFFLATIPFSSALAAELTERDWMVALVDALGWSYGLPDEPQDPDYINILTGNRELRFEAEDIYDKRKDNISVMSFINFGDFSGKGWVHNARTPSDVHLAFNLPLAGEYTVKAKLRKSEHQFKIGEKIKRVEAGQKFEEVSLGSLLLQAGPQEIIVTLPPGGSIDYISLSAPNSAMIIPADGWTPDKALSWGVINTTLLQLFKCSEVFPLSTDPIVLEAEEFQQTGTKIVSIPHLGLPSSGQWLRAETSEAQVRIPLESIETGFYDVTLRGIGDYLRVVLGGHQTIEINAKAYLDNYTFAALYFAGGQTDILVTLPPSAGIDQITLTRNQVDYDKLPTLFGLEQYLAPTASDLDTIITLLAAFGVER